MIYYQKGLRSLHFGVDLLKKYTREGNLHKETLNKDMVNRITGLLTVISNGDIDKALKVLTFYASLSTDWDKVKPDIEEFYL